MTTEHSSKDAPATDEHPDVTHWRSLYLEADKHLKAMGEKYSRLYWAVDGVLVLTHECKQIKDIAAIAAIRNILILAKGDE